MGVCSEIFSQSPVTIGDSICVSGVCLTVVKFDGTTAYFDIASETRRVTILSSLAVGSRLNLERSLLVGERIHGHFVTGHVDAVTTVSQRREEGGNTVRFEFALPARLRRYVAPKGSVAINGTSLTVGEVSGESFSVYIVPHTLSETTFGELVVGSSVNVEVDILSRYVVQALGEIQSHG